jgi:photosystem II stability/assembly factor-like uncharacterized protein
MSVVAPPRPPAADDHPNVEALEALIEEARQRTRRRRRRYGASTFVTAAAGLLGFYGFNHGGGAIRPQDRAEPPLGGAVAPAQGDAARWALAPGLEGADVSELVFDPQHPSIAFAATENADAGIFTSSDGGRSWKQLDTTGIGSRVDAVVVAPQHPTALYVGTEAGIFKTNDGGASWHAASMGLFDRETAQERENRFALGYVDALFVDPRDPKTLYAGTEEGLFRSTDGGAHWQSSLTDVGPVAALAFDPTSATTLYAGTEPASSITSGSGVFKSTDAGHSWSLLGLAGRSVCALAVDPKRPNTVYAATSTGSMFRSADGGSSWRAIGSHPSSFGMLMDPENPETVYASEGDRIFKSSDGGGTWRTLNVGRRAAMLGFDPRTSTTLYARDLGRPVDLPGAGILVSTNGGVTWGDLSAGPTTVSVQSLIADATSPGVAYAATDGRGVFKRTADGWQSANYGLTTLDVRVLTAGASHPAVIFAGTSDGVFKSTDRAASWQPLPGFPRVPISALAVDTLKASTVYAIAANGGIYRSTDGGASSEELARRLDTTAGLPSLALDPRDPETVWAAGGGLLKSSDGGRDWRNAGLVGPTHALALDANNPAIVYVATDAAVFKSTSGGTSWKTLPGPPEGKKVRALAIDSEHRRRIYAGTDSGVFASYDGGLSWRRIGRDLPPRTIAALAIDPAGDPLYAGALGAGIFQLSVAR